jgi:hypothetical protein
MPNRNDPPRKLLALKKWAHDARRMTHNARRTCRAGCFWGTPPKKITPKVVSLEWICMPLSNQLLISNFCCVVGILTSVIQEHLVTHTAF